MKECVWVKENRAIYIEECRLYVIDARNVNDAYVVGYSLIVSQGIERNSRNGIVLEFPSPVATMYEKPQERVLFCPNRNANPFFHLMESLWMLHGRNDLEFVHMFNKRMKDYSDDGIKFHAAYGHRWRAHFCFDQLKHIIRILSKDPDSRRAVLQMWDPVADLGKDLKDLPCNTTIYFRISSNNNLDMTVCNRSNDVIWGTYGANVVHMSILQEYIASMLHLEIGYYYQFSNNFHAYTKILNKIQPPEDRPCPYSLGFVSPFPLIDDSDNFDHDLNSFFSRKQKYSNSFFNAVAEPVFTAWMNWRSGDYQTALRDCDDIAALDWQQACRFWFLRRLETQESGGAFEGP